jgi:flagellar protein FlaG
VRIENGFSNNQSIAISTAREVKPPVESTRISGSYCSLANKPAAELTMDEKQWISLIEKANKAIIGGTRSFEFSIHEGTNEIMIKVIDNETKEVIREIPNEKILDMVAKMWEMAGIFVDERR